MGSGRLIVSEPPSPSSPLRTRGWFADPRLRQLFRNAWILLQGKLVNAVAGLAALAIAGRALGVETFGALALIHAYTQMIGEIAKFQSWQAVLRYGTPALAEGRMKDFHRLLRLTVFLDVAGALVGMVLALAIACAWGETLLGWPQETITAALLYVTSVIFMVQATPTGILRLIDRFDILSVQSTLGAIIRMIAGAIAWLVGGGLVAFLIAWYVATALSGAYLIYRGWAELRRRGMLEGFSWRGDGTPMAAGFEGVWRFVWSTNFSTTVDLIFTHFATLAVGMTLGTRDAALYRVARQIGEAMAKPAKLMTPAIYPEISRMLVAGEYAAIRALIGRSAVLAGAGAGLAVALCALCGELVLRLTMGADFVPAFPTMLWLVAAAAIGIVAFPFEPLLVAAGRAGKALTIRLWVAGLYAPLLFWALSNQGLNGAGWTRALASVAALIGFATPALLWLNQRIAERGSPTAADGHS
jgi:O-antigen/teichoic acid export membrane protein